MSIQTEAERIIQNVANAYTALSSKGATMPDTQNSDNLADTVASLVTGGSNIAKITSGVFTLSSSISGQSQFSHGLGAVPDMVLLFCMGVDGTNFDTAGTSYYQMSFAKVVDVDSSNLDQPGCLVVGYANSSGCLTHTIADTSSLSPGSFKPTASKFYVLGNMGGTITAGLIYHWVAVKFAE